MLLIKAKFKDLKYKFFRKLYKDGIIKTLGQINIWILHRTKIILNLKNSIVKRQEYLSKKIYDEFGGYVRYGDFKGVKLYKNSWWGKTDKANMLLGIYEKEVVKEIVSISKSKRKKYFIDIGAADGYYGISTIYKKLYEHAYMFELSDIGQTIIDLNAKVNGVSEKITVRGEVRNSLYEYLDKDIIEDSLILIDIEGEEFELLSDDFIYEVRNSILIIELHESYFEDGKDKLNSLQLKCEKYFKIDYIISGGRNLSKFPELQLYSDNDRWLICSEGRNVVGRWMFLNPLQNG